jgi:hypothetical protein
LRRILRILKVLESNVEFTFLEYDFVQETNNIYVALGVIGIGGVEGSSVFADESKVCLLKSDEYIQRLKYAKSLVNGRDEANLTKDLIICMAIICKFTLCGDSE